MTITASLYVKPCTYALCSQQSLANTCTCKWKLKVVATLNAKGIASKLLKHLSVLDQCLLQAPLN